VVNWFIVKANVLWSRDDDDDEDDDGKSEVSLTSQNSYDPQNPNFRDKDSEIGSSSPSSQTTKDEEASPVVLVRQQPRPDPGTSHSSTQPSLSRTLCLKKAQYSSILMKFCLNVQKTLQ